MTPAEFERAQWAHLRRRDSEDRRLVSSAYYVAMFSRQQRLPSLATILTPTRKLEQEEKDDLQAAHEQMIARLEAGRRK